MPSPFDVQQANKTTSSKITTQQPSPSPSSGTCTEQRSGEPVPAGCQVTNPATQGFMLLELKSLLNCEYGAVDGGGVLSQPAKIPHAVLQTKMANPDFHSGFMMCKRLISCGQVGGTHVFSKRWSATLGEQWVKLRSLCTFVHARFCSALSTYLCSPQA